MKLGPLVFTTTTKKFASVPVRVHEKKNNKNKREKERQRNWCLSWGVRVTAMKYWEEKEKRKEKKVLFPRHYCLNIYIYILYMLYII